MHEVKLCTTRAFRKSSWNHPGVSDSQGTPKLFLDQIIPLMMFQWETCKLVENISFHFGFPISWLCWVVVLWWIFSNSFGAASTGFFISNPPTRGRMESKDRSLSSTRYLSLIDCMNFVRVHSSSYVQYSCKFQFANLRWQSAI